MCHRSHDRYAVEFACKCVASTCGASNVCCPGSAHGTVRSLCAPESKLHDVAFFAGKPHSRGLCCDETLKVAVVENKPFDYLCFNEICVYAYDRFLRKYNRSFLKRVKISRKFKCLEIVKKSLLKDSL